MQLVSKISNLCDHNPPTLQTDGQTDGQTDRRHAIPRPRKCTKVHCAVKVSKMPEFYMIFARKMPEFYIIIVRKIFFPNFRGHVPPPPYPPSPTPMLTFCFSLQPMTAYRRGQHCASLAGLVLSFIACFILLVIAPLAALTFISKTSGLYAIFTTRAATVVQFLAHSKNELMQWRGVRRLSVWL